MVLNNIVAHQTLFSMPLVLRAGGGIAASAILLGDVCKDLEFCSLEVSDKMLCLDNFLLEKTGTWNVLIYFNTVKFLNFVPTSLTTLELLLAICKIISSGRNVIEIEIIPSIMTSYFGD